MSQRSRFAYCPQDVLGDSLRMQYISEFASQLNGLLNSHFHVGAQDLFYNSQFKETLDGICEWWLGAGTILHANEKEFRNRQEWLAKQKQDEKVAV